MVEEDAFIGLKLFTGEWSKGWSLQPILMLSTVDSLSMNTLNCSSLCFFSISPRTRAPRISTQRPFRSIVQFQAFGNRKGSPLPIFSIVFSACSPLPLCHFAFILQKYPSPLLIPFKVPLLFAFLLRLFLPCWYVVLYVGLVQPVPHPCGGPSDAIRRKPPSQQRWLSPNKCSLQTHQLPY